MSDDDRRRILDLLAQGKITVDEAADLLRALGESDARRPAADPAAFDARPKYLRITVSKKGGRAGNGPATYAWPGCVGGGAMPREINIRVPLSLVRSGMRLGAIVPGAAGDVMSQVLRDRGINVDLSKLSPDQLDAVLKEMGEITVDADQGRAQVRISAE